MIGDLLKQLPIAFGKYVRYQTRRIRGRKDTDTQLGKQNFPDFEALSDEARLDAKLVEPVSWPTYRSDVPPAELLSDPLYRMWAATAQGHKWTHYFWVYQEVFGPRRKDPMRVLEIGVFQGSSLRMWKTYFTHAKTVIVGIDIRPDCIQHDSPRDRVHVRIGSQSDPDFLQRIVDEFGPFDLIIDDGSHQSSHMIASFNILFANGLKDSGIYFVEDTHANYWRPWRDSRRSFLDMSKELLDHMNAHYRAAPSEVFLIDKPSNQPLTSLSVPLITTMIKQIRFFDSIVVIYKAKLEYIPYYLKGK